ncbi:MAG: hypothetical protein QN213_06820 [Armatimonadota bacterium]|nr:hypothetical protein [Armatimonadota bacterium]MDR7605967.1 hypothetical protein [Armatimonadota bacterium]MDR7608775.1 hypothetical protein [Armatimonadota bacterium]
MTSQAVVNGVDVGQLVATVEAIKANPDLARFTGPGLVEVRRWPVGRTGAAATPTPQ